MSVQLALDLNKVLKLLWFVVLSKVKDEQSNAKLQIMKQYIFVKP